MTIGLFRQASGIAAICVQRSLISDTASAILKFKAAANTFPGGPGLNAIPALQAMRTVQP